MDLADLAGLFIDSADLAGDHEPHRGGLLPAGTIEVQGQGQLPFEFVGAWGHRLQLGAQFLEPLRVGAVAGAHHLHPFVAAPEIQVLQVGFPAGGDGETGVEVQVGNDFHGFPPYHKSRGRAKF